MWKIQFETPSGMLVMVHIQSASESCGASCLSSHWLSRSLCLYFSLYAYVFGLIFESYVVIESTASFGPYMNCMRWLNIEKHVLICIITCLNPLPLRIKFIEFYKTSEGSKEKRKQNHDKYTFAIWQIVSQTKPREKNWVVCLFACVCCCFFLSKLVPLNIQSRNCARHIF